MFHVYVIESVKSGRLYRGCTADLKRRIKEHNQGRVNSTKAYRPYKLIYYEAFVNKTDALRQEKYLKSGSGRELVAKKLSNYFKTSKGKRSLKLMLKQEFSE